MKKKIFFLDGRNKSWSFFDRHRKSKLIQKEFLIHDKHKEPSFILDRQNEYKPVVSSIYTQWQTFLPF